MTRPPVSILCFHAGGVPFALAVADVIGLGASSPDARPVAELLGLEDAVDTGAARRLLTLAGPGGPVGVLIDGPLALRDLRVDQVVPAPAGLPRATAVLGFAQLDDALIQLLDVDALLATIRAEGL